MRLSARFWPFTSNRDQTLNLFYPGGAPAARLNWLVEIGEEE